LHEVGDSLDGDIFQHNYAFNGLQVRLPSILGRLNFGARDSEIVEILVASQMVNKLLSELLIFEVDLLQEGKYRVHLIRVLGDHAHESVRLLISGDAWLHLSHGL
jgi:hypothetical protein